MGKHAQGRESRNHYRSSIGDTISCREPTENKHPTRQHRILAGLLPLGLAALLLFFCGPLAAQITITIDDGDPRTPNIKITLPAETVASLDLRRL